MYKQNIKGPRTGRRNKNLVGMKVNHHCCLFEMYDLNHCKTVGYQKCQNVHAVVLGGLHDQLYQKQLIDIIV